MRRTEGWTKSAFLAGVLMAGLAAQAQEFPPCVEIQGNVQGPEGAAPWALRGAAFFPPGKAAEFFAVVDKEEPVFFSSDASTKPDASKPEDLPEKLTTWFRGRSLIPDDRIEDFIKRFVANERPPVVLALTDSLLEQQDTWATATAAALESFVNQAEKPDEKDAATAAATPLTKAEFDAVAANLTVTLNTNRDALEWAFSNLEAKVEKLEPKVEKKDVLTLDVSKISMVVLFCLPLIGVLAAVALWMVAKLGGDYAQEVWTRYRGVQTPWLNMFVEGDLKRMKPRAVPLQKLQQNLATYVLGKRPPFSDLPSVYDLLQELKSTLEGIRNRPLYSVGPFYPDPTKHFCLVDIEYGWQTAYTNERSLLNAFPEFKPVFRKGQELTPEAWSFATTLIRTRSVVGEAEPGSQGACDKSLTTKETVSLGTRDMLLEELGNALGCPGDFNSIWNAFGTFKTSFREYSSGLLNRDVRSETLPDLVQKLARLSGPNGRDGLEQLEQVVCSYLSAYLVTERSPVRKAVQFISEFHSAPALLDKFQGQPAAAGGMPVICSFGDVVRNVDELSVFLNQLCESTDAKGQTPLRRWLEASEKAANWCRRYVRFVHYLPERLNGDLNKAYDCIKDYEQVRQSLVSTLQPPPDGDKLVMEILNEHKRRARAALQLAPEQDPLIGLDKRLETMRREQRGLVDRALISCGCRPLGAEDDIAQRVRELEEEARGPQMALRLGLHAAQKNWDAAYALAEAELNRNWGFIDAPGARRSIVEALERLNRGHDTNLLKTLGSTGPENWAHQLWRSELLMRTFGSTCESLQPLTDVLGLAGSALRLAFFQVGDLVGQAPLLQPSPDNLEPAPGTVLDRNVRKVGFDLIHWLVTSGLHGFFVDVSMFPYKRKDGLARKGKGVQVTPMEFQK